MPLADYFATANWLDRATQMGLNPLMANAQKPKAPSVVQPQEALGVSAGPAAPAMTQQDARTILAALGAQYQQPQAAAAQAAPARTNSLADSLALANRYAQDVGEYQLQQVPSAFVPAPGPLGSLLGMGQIIPNGRQAQMWPVDMREYPPPFGAVSNMAASQEYADVQRAGLEQASQDARTAALANAARNEVMNVPGVGPVMRPSTPAQEALLENLGVKNAGVRQSMIPREAAAVGMIGSALSAPTVFESAFNRITDKNRDLIPSDKSIFDADYNYAAPANKLLDVAKIVKDQQLSREQQQTVAAMLIEYLNSDPHAQKIYQQEMSKESSSISPILDLMNQNFGNK